MTLLEIDGLSLRTGDGRQVLSDLSLTVGAGARVGLIGESGSGKSLTALASVGLLPAGVTASGSVLVHPPGRAPVQVVGSTDRVLDRVRGSTVALVFQEPGTALDPLMRAGRQVAEPLRRHRGLRGRALRRALLAALDEVRIDDPDRVSRAFPHELSGGQRQRVAIAAALACEPALLVADEPTTALDVTVQADVLALLDGLVTARGMALLFISHDLAVVSRVTDDVVVLRAGSVVESGPLREILSAPRHPYTRELLTAARAFDDALDRGAP